MKVLRAARSRQGTLLKVSFIPMRMLQPRLQSVREKYVFNVQITPAKRRDQDFSYLTSRAANIDSSRLRHAASVALYIGAFFAPLDKWENFTQGNILFALLLLLSNCDEHNVRCQRYSNIIHWFLN